MKPIILITLFYSFSLKAQSDTLWPNVEAFWSVEASHYDGAGGSLWKTFHYHQESDSIFLYGKYWHTFKTSNNPVGLISFTNSKVYFRVTQPFKIIACCSNYSDTSEVILYDFSGDVGDTVNFDYAGDPITVIQKSDTLYDSAQRAVFYLSNSDIWIAGVGSLSGLFPLNMVTGFGFANWPCWFEGSYKDSLGLSYTLSQGNLGDCTASIEQNKEAIDFYLQNDFLIVKPKEQSLLKIYSISGELLKSKNLEAYENKISINDLAKGVYIIQAGNSLAQKLVIP